MPNIGFQEILVILVIALLIFGPRKLPEIGKSLGQGLREFKKVSNDLTASLTSAMDEEPAQPKHTEEQPTTSKEGEA